MAVPAELMAALQGGGAPGGPGGRPQETGLPGQTPPGLERDPGHMEPDLEADPLDVIDEMIDLAQDFIDSQEIPMQGKQIMSKILADLHKLSSSEEKVAGAEGGSSLIAHAQAP